MITKLEEDLKMYTGQIEDLNKELASIEDKKREIIRVGTRLEGVVAYLRKVVEEESLKNGLPSTEAPK